MRKIVIAATVLIGVAVSPVFATSNAHAEPYYKWCAMLNVGDAAYNCGFVTIAQCRATISGIGGFCEPNPFYFEPVRKSPRAARTRRPN